MKIVVIDSGIGGFANDYIVAKGGEVIILEKNTMSSYIANATTIANEIPE